MRVSAARYCAASCFALRGEAGEGRLAQVLAGRLHEFGLARRRFLGAAGDGEIGQREIGLEAADGGVEGGAGDAEGLRGGPGGLQELVEGGVGMRGRREQKCGQKCERKSHFRHARLYAGHPRLRIIRSLKTWMAGTSPAMTKKVTAKTSYTSADAE